jgi:proteasome lid subunit RPN8/RPN11
VINLTSIGAFQDLFEIYEPLWQAMLAHVTGCLPEEACGLVAIEREQNAEISTIRSIRAAAILPIENELHSQVRFRMAPAEQLKAFYWLEERRLELGAIFHSHPKGPDRPSATDLAEFAYPGVLMLIVSPLDSAIFPQMSEDWQIRAYRIDGGLSPRLSANEVRLVRLADRNNSPHEVL